MKSIKSDNAQWVVKLSKGELVHESLKQFCIDNQIINASISGIGAVEWVRCGYYDLPNQDYVFQEYNEIVEVASYSGNCMQKENGVFVHAHGVFSDRNNNPFAGHVDEMRVGVTMEIILTPLSTTLERKFDPETGLYLIAIN